MIVVGTAVRRMTEEEADKELYRYNAYDIEKFMRWATAVSEISYPEYQAYVVDNTGDDRFIGQIARVCSKIPMNYILHHIEEMNGENPEERIGRSLEVIRKYAEKVGADYILTLGGDVIVPVNVLNILKAEINGYDFVMPRVKTRNGRGYYYSYCCCLLSKRAFESTDFLGWGNCDPQNPETWYMNDGWVITKLIRAGMKYKLIEVDIGLDHIRD